MKVSLINIGDELLIGQVVNTNAAKMAQMLTEAGFCTTDIFTIGDNAEKIDKTLQKALDTTDIVLITGGLGPTKDDITKKTLCNYFRSELYENEIALDNVKRLMAERGKELTDLNRTQALVPKCCTMINNFLGTAPCMWFDITDREQKKVVVSLPGVPYEMIHLMREEIIPRLQAKFLTENIVHKNILVQGIGESFLSDLIEDWELSLPDNLHLAYLPQPGLTKLRLTAQGKQTEELEEEVKIAIGKLYPIAGQYIVAENFESLAEVVAATMTRNGKTLATAESCTGGAIASKLTALPGASDYFVGGIVSYSNEIKECALGVSHATLKAHGAVSEETVIEMAEGVRKRLGSDYAVATTGIAGPGGGSPEKPVGTVWIGVSNSHHTITRKLFCPGQRAQVIERTCNEIFATLLRTINEK